MDGTSTKDLWISDQTRWRWQRQQGPHFKSPRGQSGGTTEVKVPWCHLQPTPCDVVRQRTIEKNPKLSFDVTRVAPN